MEVSHAQQDLSYNLEDKMGLFPVEARRTSDEDRVLSIEY